MQTVWFILVGFLLTMYVLLDGFDLGSGALYPFVARTDKERRAVLKAILPVWDGNEVWLIAAGGALLLAFPLLYASSLSGFYLPMFILLWLLIARGVAIEMRGTVKNRLWHSLWDAAFFFGSLLLPFFFGVAMANIMRGVPIEKGGYFFMPLWTNFVPTGLKPGILDWYTVLIGLLALAVLVMHGMNYLAVKTEGGLHARSRIYSATAWVCTAGLTALATPITFGLFPERFQNFTGAPWGFIFPAVAIVGLLAMPYFFFKERDKAVFACSAAYIAGMISSTAFAVYPDVLPAVNPANSLTIYNASTTTHGLVVGLIWWSFGITLASTYFIIIYRMFRGKVRVD